VKRVFLSSVAKGLESFRDGACKAINRLDGYHCVRMEDFGARSKAPQEYCLEAVESCDCFIGIIGQRYGSCPPGCSESFTELEYRAAEKANIPRLMMIAPDDLLVPANHREPDEAFEKLKRFRDEVFSQNTAAFFKSEESLALAVVTALQNERQQQEHEAHKNERPEVQMTEPSSTSSGANKRTHLLFPYVVCVAGFDTGISIANAGLDPFGTKGRTGACTFHYYGTSQVVRASLRAQTSAVVRPGEVLTYVASSGSTSWGLDGRAAGFIGYIVVECDFPFAHGFGYISALGAQPTSPGPSSSYLATVIQQDRSTG
jgi:hypothetical protein